MFDSGADRPVPPVPDSPADRTSAGGDDERGPIRGRVIPGWLNGGADSRAVGPTLPVETPEAGDAEILAARYCP